MAGTRTTIGGIGSKFPSREKGTRAGLGLNTFGLQALAEGITGEALAPIVLEAWQPAFEAAYSEWPVLTGASRDSIELGITEIGPRLVRVALQAGGQKLIEDPRNKSHKDYAPYIEFNGTSTTPAGTMTHAVHSTADEAKARIARGVAELMRSILGK